jgi:transaldolase/glucose-6-phosphate isomerase
MTDPIHDLHALGQSIWYDNIARRLLENGELKGMIERGEIRGMTSNPSIFQNAIAKSKDYDSALVTMAWAGYSTGEILEQLVLEDIQVAADLLLPLYHSSQGGDGYISLEVSPRLAYDSAGTLAETQRLWQAVDRPNLMIKIPATRLGLLAVRKAIAAGINVNVTLIFSLTRYQEVMEAYLAGLEDRLGQGKSVESIASVASFFVSRMDSKVDQLLEMVIAQGGKNASPGKRLLGKSAVANARLAYQSFLKVFRSERFEMLKEQDARLQRPLWASTSTKNPAYADTLYVDALVGPDTINTVPPQTLRAFADHGKASLTIDQEINEAKQVFRGLERLGISVGKVTEELEEEGVKAFSDAYDALLDTLETRRAAAEQDLGCLASYTRRRVAKFETQQVPARLHAIDPTLWTTDPGGQAEIRQRLGWLNLPTSSRKMVAEVEKFAAEVKKAGFTHGLLLGMGGSSLAPEVMSEVYGKPKAGLELFILDSTDPAAVKAAGRRSPLEKTLYIVASKSGGTAEGTAFLDYFWKKAEDTVGEQKGQHFIAITDPNTSLAKLAKERHFRKIFLADPTVGGRFSALSAFGVVPAGLMGYDLARFLSQGEWMSRQCAADMPAGRNPGLVLGALLGEAALQGRDKLTLWADPELESFGSWLEQLVAESTGKMGLGIVPIDGEAWMGHKFYGRDRLFVYLRRSGKYNRKLEQIRKQGQPAIVLDMPAKEDLAAEFYRWEVATAAACSVLGVNAFDQPDVQDSKTRTIHKIQEYKNRGKFDEGEAAWQEGGLRLYGTGEISKAKDLVDALHIFLGQGRAGNYVAINAYLPRTISMKRLLQRLRTVIGEKTGLATTVGFGPRFLHSTGQLHKGGSDRGMFLQITLDVEDDLPIPNQGITFGTLERAQALGDLEALQGRGRRVLRMHFNSLGGLESLIRSLG